MGIPGDEFIRTTDEKHHRTVQWLFKRCRDNGYIEKGHYTGQYCVYDNAYVVEAGPGDPCPDCGRPTETVTEENYFFKLSEFQQKLLDFYAANPDFIQPESRRNEVLSFVQRRAEESFDYAHHDSLGNSRAWRGAARFLRVV